MQATNEANRRKQTPPRSKQATRKGKNSNKSLDDIDDNSKSKRASNK